MCKLNVGDFYYGSFLSALLNAPGGKPSIFEESNSRRIYRFETEKNGECFFFAKYVHERKNKNDKYSHWIFNFTNGEVAKLQELYMQKNNVKIVLICVKDGLGDSELAVVNYEDAIECLGINCGVKNYRINIKALDKKRGLRMYGSGHSDIVNGMDNTLRVSRQLIKDL